MNREFIRRGDVGDCIMMIGNEYIYYGLGRYMTSAYFEEIWGKRGTLSHGENVLINFKNQIYLDND